MTELPTTFTREWVEFPNPENPEQIFKCDLTWLTSYWNCIFGNGCEGIDKELPDHGCCSDGAYYYSSDDEARVTVAAKKLPASMWQNHSIARKGGKFTISEIGLDKIVRLKKSITLVSSSMNQHSPKNILAAHFITLHSKKVNTSSKLNPTSVGNFHSAALGRVVKSAIRSTKLL